jgi:FtsH-binding integral membrane protein
MVARRFETYLAGSILLLLGLILVGYLSGFNSPRQIPAIFIAGVGVIFTLLAVFKAKTSRQKYEMSPRTTLAYGVLALVIGVLWFSVSLQAQVAEYLLALLLVFFGLVFLAYTRLKQP